jgi:hypothetical protein
VRDAAARCRLWAALTGVSGHVARVAALAAAAGAQSAGAGQAAGQVEDVASEIAEGCR